MDIDELLRDAVLAELDMLLDKLDLRRNEEIEQALLELCMITMKIEAMLEQFNRALARYQVSMKDDE